MPHRSMDKSSPFSTLKSCDQGFNFAISRGLSVLNFHKGRVVQGTYTYERLFLSATEKNHKCSVPANDLVMQSERNVYESVIFSSVKKCESE